ncbi:MAG: hypothetical protein Q8Q76_00495 [Methylotenera sp.]|nr:hypothetical protein [Methylotenera sp.]
MNNTHKTIALTIGSAFALSIAATTVNAAENPFTVKSLSSGYQVADHHETKTKDGKCGAGKCGASMKKVDKAKEGSCSAEKMKDGSCNAEKKAGASATDKAKEGACSAEKMKEGSCSADKK